MGCGYGLKVLMLWGSLKNSTFREGGSKKQYRKGDLGVVFLRGMSGTPMHTMHWLQTLNKYNITIFILEYRKMMRSDNNGTKGVQKMWQFWKRHSAPVRAYN